MSNTIKEAQEFFEFAIWHGYDALMSKLKKEAWRTPDKSYFTNESCGTLSKMNNRPKGYQIHHIREDQAFNLSSRDSALSNLWDWQLPENLVYLSLGEHILAHTLIRIEDRSMSGYTDGNLLLIKQCDEIGTDYDKELSTLSQSLMNRYLSILRGFDEENILFFWQIIEAFYKNPRVLFTLATGGGKTYMMKAISLYFNIPTLAIAWQQTNEHSISETLESVGIDVVLHTRLSQVDFSKYKLLLIDEMHHYVYKSGAKGNNCGEEIKSYLNKYPNLHVLGVTATQQRSDGREISKFFGFEWVAGYSLNDGIAKGIFWPIEIIGSITDLNTKSVSVDNEINRKKIFKTLKENWRDDMKGIIYIDESQTPSMEKLIHEIDPNIECRSIYYTLKNQNEENRKWFEQTNKGIVFNLNIAKESWHPSGVNTEIVINGTDKRPVFDQMIGRLATKTTYVTQDPHLKYIDFSSPLGNLSVNYISFRKRRLLKIPKFIPTTIIQQYETQLCSLFSKDGPALVLSSRYLVIDATTLKNEGSYILADWLDKNQKNLDNTQISKIFLSNLPEGKCYGVHNKFFINADLLLPTTIKSPSLYQSLKDPFFENHRLSYYGDFEYFYNEYGALIFACGMRSEKSLKNKRKLISLFFSEKEADDKIQQEDQCYLRLYLYEGRYVTNKKLSYEEFSKYVKEYEERSHVYRNHYIGFYSDNTNWEIGDGYINVVEVADQQDKAEEEAAALQRKAKKEARKAAENQIKGTIYKVNKGGRISIFTDINTMLGSLSKRLRKLVRNSFQQKVNKVKYKNIVVTRSENNP